MTRDRRASRGRRPWRSSRCCRWSWPPHWRSLRCSRPVRLASSPVTPRRRGRWRCCRAAIRPMLRVPRHPACRARGCRCACGGGPCGCASARVRRSACPRGSSRPPWWRTRGRDERPARRRRPLPAPGRDCAAACSGPGRGGAAAARRGRGPLPAARCGGPRRRGRRRARARARRSRRARLLLGCAGATSRSHDAGDRYGPRSRPVARRARARRRRERPTRARRGRGRRGRGPGTWRRRPARPCWWSPGRATQRWTRCCARRTTSWWRTRGRRASPRSPRRGSQPTVSATARCAVPSGLARRVPALGTRAPVDLRGRARAGDDPRAGAPARRRHRRRGARRGGARRRCRRRARPCGGPRRAGRRASDARRLRPALRAGHARRPREPTAPGARRVPRGRPRAPRSRRPGATASRTSG